MENIINGPNYFQMMEDAQEDLFRVSQKMLALRLILTRYNSSDMPAAIRERLQGLAE
jgi:acyl-CoA thioesterase FadM